LFCAATVLDVLAGNAGGANGDSEGEVEMSESDSSANGLWRVIWARPFCPIDIGDVRAIVAGRGGISGAFCLVGLSSDCKAG
jgi:hypothetical protein